MMDREEGKVPLRELPFNPNWVSDARAVKPEGSAPLKLFGPIKIVFNLFNNEN